MSHQVRRQLRTRHFRQRRQGQLPEADRVCLQDRQRPQSPRRQPRLGDDVRHNAEHAVLPERIHDEVRRPQRAQLPLHGRRNKHGKRHRQDAHRRLHVRQRRPKRCCKYWRRHHRRTVQRQSEDHPVGDECAQAGHGAVDCWRREQRGRQRDEGRSQLPAGPQLLQDRQLQQPRRACEQPHPSHM